MILLGAFAGIIMESTIALHSACTQTATIVETTQYKVGCEYPERIAEPKKMRVTCYTSSEGAITASGTMVHEGIVAASRDYMDCVAILYDEDMNFVGFFEVKDTGAGIDTDGDGKGDSIKKGLSIDVYRDTLDRCYDWIEEYGDYMYVQFVEGKG